jgi:adenylyltransferase/sulfurtransferase
LDLPGLADKLKNISDVKQNEYLLRFVSGENEMTVFSDGRAIIRGTDDVTVARSLYAKYIGS